MEEDCWGDDDENDDDDDDDDDDCGNRRHPAVPSWVCYFIRNIGRAIRAVFAPLRGDTMGAAGALSGTSLLGAIVEDTGQKRVG